MTARDPGSTTSTSPHLAFTVDSRDDVATFYRAALETGGTALLEPAIHPEYHDDYFGAFVQDPHGINLEAVCHRHLGPDTV